MNIRLIKKMCNGVVLTMFLFSVVMLARYSDLPNYFSIQFLNKPESPSNIGMSLYTSFIVTAVFYFFMNLVPDLVNAAEKEKRELPKRIAIQRDIQILLSGYIHIWEALEKYTGGNKHKCIHGLFDDRNIKDVSMKIKLLDMSNVSNPDGKYLTWENAIYNKLDCLMYKCNRIFQLYSGQLPENVHFYLNYLLQEDQLMNGLYSNVKMFYNQVNESNSLYNFIAKDGDGNLHLEKTRECLKYLVEWTNSEYDYIKEKGGLNISDRIFPVKI